jgi:hypothetical protein
MMRDFAGKERGFSSYHRRARTAKTTAMSSSTAAMMRKV